MLSNSSWRAAPQGRLGGGALVVVVCGALLWLGLFLHARGRLTLQNHVAQTLPVPGSPAGPAAQAADGRLFVVTAEQQLVALSPAGDFAWNKRLATPVTPVPIVASPELLVLVGPGVLYGFSLGGEERFRVEADAALGDLVGADGTGHLFLLDTRGSLTIFDEAGKRTSRTSLGLRHHRRLIVLPGGQVLGAGTRDDQTHHLFWAEGSGLVGIRSLLPAAPVGLSLSGRPGELAAVTAGSELWTLAAQGPPEQLMRRLTLPGPALSAPLLPAEGGAYVLIQQGDREELCRLDDQSRSSCVPTGEPALADGLPRQPTLARNGLVYVQFAARSRLVPSFHGVLAVSPRGVAYRQALPGAAAVALTVDWSGALIASVAGERYLFRLDSGLGAARDAYSAWPQPLGSPAAASRGWPSQ